MIEPPHPSTCIPAHLATAIRDKAHDAEILGRLHPEQLVVIYSQNWFNLFVPKAIGGLELSLPEALAIEEGLAWADGSTGWTVTLCSGANWFVGFFQPETAATIFSDKQVCLAGSGQPSGIAKVTENGYNITGRWRYATGAPHATAFTANCIIEREDITLLNGDGSPLVYSFIFLRDEVVIHNDWHTNGMVATASNSFEVANLYVPGNRRFVIDAGGAVLNNPIYQYPFLQFAQATLAINVSGMAVRFTDLCETMFAERAGSKIFTVETASTMAYKLNIAKQRLHEARRQFYIAMRQSWGECASYKTINPVLLNEVSVKSNALATTALHVVDGLYPYCGLAAANPETEINRVWRNLHTASQHSLLTPV